MNDNAKESKEKDIAYLNIYEDVSMKTLSVSRTYLATKEDAVQAAEGTCKSGMRKYIARIRVEWNEGQFDQ